MAHSARLPMSSVIKKVAKLLEQTLAEEEKTDQLLTQLSPPILQQAMEPEEEEEEVEA